MANDIKSQTGRKALQPRGAPYWEKRKAGCFVGYRKLAEGAGTWLARWRDDAGKQHYSAIGGLLIDDRSTFDSVVKQADDWFNQCENGVSTQPTTVQQACEHYVTALESINRKETAKDAKGRFSRLVYDLDFGKITLDKLTAKHVKKWHTDQLTVGDSDQVTAGEDKDERRIKDDSRRSKDSANRNLSSLKAALNSAFKDHLVANDAAWKTIKAFPGVSKGRSKTSFLSHAQRQSLLDACPADLALLVKGLLLLGCRPGELASMRVGDYNKRTGTITLDGKTDERTVAVSAVAGSFLAEQQKDKLPTAPMFSTSYGQPWNKDSWKKIFKTSAKTAELPEEIVLYSLRHTAISEMIKAGMDSFIVSRLTGTSVAMIEKHYGHLDVASVTMELNRVKML